MQYLLNVRLSRNGSHHRYSPIWVACYQVLPHLPSCCLRKVMWSYWILLITVITLFRKGLSAYPAAIIGTKVRRCAQPIVGWSALSSWQKLYWSRLWRNQSLIAEQDDADVNLPFITEMTLWNGRTFREIPPTQISISTSWRSN